MLKKFSIVAQTSLFSRHAESSAKKERQTTPNAY
jgi:hypothetical protein